VADDRGRLLDLTPTERAFLADMLTGRSITVSTARLEIEYVTSPASCSATKPRRSSSATGSALSADPSTEPTDADRHELSDAVARKSMR